MTKPTVQQCHAMTTYYSKKYSEVTGKSTVVNRNKARWGFESVLMDFSPVETRELIDYYLEHYNTPSIDWFLFNYDKVVVAKQEHNEKEKVAEKRRQQTAERLEEWRNRWKSQES